MICEADGNCLFLNFGFNIEGEIARRKTVLEHRRATGHRVVRFIWSETRYILCDRLQGNAVYLV